MCVCLCVWYSDASKGLDRIWLITCSRDRRVCVCVCVVQQHIRMVGGGGGNHKSNRCSGTWLMGSNAASGTCMLRDGGGWGERG